MSTVYNVLGDLNLDQGELTGAGASTSYVLNAGPFTVYNSWFTQTDTILLDDWPDGDFSLEIVVTAVTITPVAASFKVARCTDFNRTGPGSTTPMIEASALSPTVNITGTGTYVVPYIGLTWGHGDKSDRMRLGIGFDDGIGSSIVTFTARLTAPWTAAAANTWSLHTSSPSVLDSTFAAAPAAWAYSPWEFPPYIIQAPDAARARLRMLMGAGQ